MVFFALLFLDYASLNSTYPSPTPSLEGRGGIYSGDPEREFRKGRGWIRGIRPVCQAFYDLGLGLDRAPKYHRLEYLRGLAGVKMEGGYMGLINGNP